MLIVSEAETGTSERDWLSDPTLLGLPGLRWRAGQPVVVVAPHPDDEVLGAGGLMRAAARLGSTVRVVAVTDGEASHPGSGWDGPSLAARRAAESASALERLGVAAELDRLRLPDGAVTENEDHLTAALCEHLTATTICLTTWRHDGHPDHDATGRAAAMAAASTGATLFEYPIWAWHWATPHTGLPLTRACRLGLEPVDLAAKRHAIRAFRSQILPLGPRPCDGPILPAAVRGRFERSFEVYLGSEVP